MRAPVLVALLSCFATTALAQEKEQPPQSSRAPDHVSYSATIGVNSSDGRWLGRTPGRDLVITSIKPLWRLAGDEHTGFSLSYFVDLVPFALVTGNPTRVLSRDECLRRHPELRAADLGKRTNFYESCAADVRDAYGLGASPLGLAARLLRIGGATLVTDVSVGAIFFNRRMPYQDAAQLNFNIAAGAGIELPVSAARAVTFGYRLHHLSSGGRGQFNPGVGAHAITAGWGRRLAPAKSKRHD